LGRARPTFRERDLARIPRPRYRLRFGVPSVAPGRYALVLYCGVCADGPQGSLITDPHNPSYGLRVLASHPAGNSEPVRLLGVVLLTRVIAPERSVTETRPPLIRAIRFVFVFALGALHA
jgi:hypothetical protein